VLDLLIRDASIVDGGGEPAFRGSVGTREDRVGWIGRDEEAEPEAARVLDGRGRTLAPGFVDVHNHSDLSPLVLPTMPSTVRQGVTTVVVGNCGSSPWPLVGFEEGVRLAYADPAAMPVPAWQGFADFLDAIDAARPAANVATLIGHGSVRQDSLGLDRRRPDAAELDRMRSTVADAVTDGAFGLSTGLIYVPGIYSATDEILALARMSARAGGLYASHIRGEGRDLFNAIDEAVRIGREAEIPTHVSHLKCESSLAWGRAKELLVRLREGGDSTADQYPYAAWNSSLASLLPPWAPVTDLEALAGDPETRANLREAVEHGESDFQSSVDGVGWDRIVVEDAADGRWRGTDIASIAEAMGTDPFAAFLRLLHEEHETSCIGHAMHDDDVRAILGDPDVFVASDASATAPDGPGGALPVHPRDYGTFPRALEICRDEGLLPIEVIVRKMTSLPADRFGIKDRGRIEVGAFADLVLFDAASVRDVATYAQPHAFPQGIELVVANGVVAWEPGAAISRAGRALRRGR
jgi:N-acyl-D-amino-acid deacylase